MTGMVLFLSDIAGSEILLIMVVILLFFGSKSIPGIARTFGQTMRQIRDASEEVKSEIRKSTDTIKTDFKAQNLVEDTIRDIEKPFEEATKSIDSDLKLDQNFVPPSPYSRPFGKPIPEQKPLDQTNETVEE
jgi:sec-independent protein translocase protein TatA